MSVEGESAIKGYTEEFDMVRDWNNGFRYINSLFIWERVMTKMIAFDLSGLSARPV